MDRFISAATIDDLLHAVYTQVLEHGLDIQPTKGPAKELFGVMMELTQPQARISRSQNRERVFSALGEWLWYLSGSDSSTHISHYVSYYKDPQVSVDGRVIGAYGPRLLNFDGVDQIQKVIATLRKNPESRNAVIQLFDHEDPERHAPCTLALQFAVRNGRLVMMTSMRSNDIFIGLPHDLFAFTMLQEVIARSLDVELGSYFHSVGSLHLYDSKIEAANRYLNEGWQDEVTMPAMPTGDPWPQIRYLVATESCIRDGSELELAMLRLPKEPYWKDLTLLLYSHKAISTKKIAVLPDIMNEMSNPYFKSVIQERIDRESSRR